MKCVRLDDGVAKKSIQLIPIKNQFNDANRTHLTDIIGLGFPLCVYARKKGKNELGFYYSHVLHLYI